MCFCSHFSCKHHNFQCHYINFDTNILDRQSSAKKILRNISKLIWIYYLAKFHFMCVCLIFSPEFSLKLIGMCLLYRGLNSYFSPLRKTGGRRGEGGSRVGMAQGTRGVWGVLGGEVVDPLTIEINLLITKGYFQPGNAMAVPKFLILARRQFPKFRKGLLEIRYGERL